MCAGRLEVGGVLAAGGRVVAALAHTRVVAQPPLVQVRVGEGVRRRHPTLLCTAGKKVLFFIRRSFISKPS